MKSEHDKATKEAQISDLIPHHSRRSADAESPRIHPHTIPIEHG